MVYEVPSLSEQYEREDTFGDALYDWMGRAPFLAIAFAIHLLAFFLLTAIPWSTASEDDAVALETQVVLPPEDDFDEPDEPVFEDPVPDEVEQDDVVFDDPVVAVEPDDGVDTVPALALEAAPSVAVISSEAPPLVSLIRKAVATIASSTKNSIT